MSSDEERTIQRTEWTNSLLQDLCAALKAQRDDETVRAFARELMDDKDLPIAYLVRKVKQSVGAKEAERLDVLVRGRYLVEKSKAAQVETEGGVRGFLRRLLG
jgi:hypothetical protein